MKANFQKLLNILYLQFIFGLIYIATLCALPKVPTKGISTALIVFAQFIDDRCDNPCCTDEETEWPKDRLKLPQWAFDVIDESERGDHTEGSITDYFCKMSHFFAKCLIISAKSQ